MPLQQVPKDQDQEIIPAYPTQEIIFKIEEIPPLDVFYNVGHKFLVKRRNIRRIDESMNSLENESMDVVWKDSFSNPTEHLTKLSHFVGVYTTTTTNKEEEVKLLLKQNEDKVQELERILEQEKLNTN